MDIDLNLEALDRAVRVGLANGGREDTAETIERANAFLTFLRSS